MSLTVLSVDPGKASGIAVVSWSGDVSHTPVLVFSSEAEPEEFSDQISPFLFEGSYQLDNFIVACETFVINAQTVRNSQAPYSLEQIGVLKHLCRSSGYPPEKISFQAPVNAKSMFPNETLKALGIWHKGGKGHANDAIRHGLLALVKNRWVPRGLNA